MPNSNADRNLLFGMLALQLDFVSRDDLVEAMNGWVLNKSRSLGEVLVERKCLSEQQNSLLDELVAEHLAQHSDDPQQSLAAVGVMVSVHQQLSRLGDDDVEASLFRAGSASVGEEFQHGATLQVGVDQSPEGRFRLLRPHARGGLGEVWLARDEELNRDVALKEIQVRHAGQPESQARFVLEAEITGGLEHPCIVPIYGMGEHADGRPYYAMRFIRGDSLKEAVDRYHKTTRNDSGGAERHLELRKLLGRFLDVCDAVEYAHSRGVLHRDLKPANIMLGKYGETLVVDWGLAKAQGRTIHDDLPALEPVSGSGASATQLGSALGTPAYMSPEQAAGRLDQLGPQSDVYSLGATLYYVLTGRAPVSDKDVDCVLRKVQQGEFPAPSQVQSQVSAGLEAICLKAMALKREDRYASARALADDIERWLADEPVSAMPDTLTQRVGRWTRRHKHLTQGATAALVLVASVSVAATLLVNGVLRGEARQRERTQQALTQESQQRDQADRDRESAEKAKAREVAQRKIAKLRTQDAQENFKLARGAVHQYHTQISDDRRFTEQGLEGLQRRLLSAARDFNEKFLEQSPDDLQLLVDQSQICQRLARLSSHLDEFAESLSASETALAICQRLAAEHPEEPDYQFELAVSYRLFGQRTAEGAEDAVNASREILETLSVSDSDNSKYQKELAAALGLLVGSGETEQQQAALYKSQEIREHLVEKHPKDAEHLSDLAASYHALAGFHRDQQRLAEAERFFRMSIGVQRRAIERDADRPECQIDLWFSLHSLGVLCQNTNQLKEAEETHTMAVDVAKRLTAKHPDLRNPQGFVSRSHYDLARVYLDTHRLPEAEEQYFAAQAIRETLVVKYPDVPAYRESLARGYKELGELYTGANVPESAKNAYKKARQRFGELNSKYPEVANYADELALVEMSLGNLFAKEDRHEEAEASFKAMLEKYQELAAAHPESTRYRHNAAAAHGRLGYLYDKSHQYEKSEMSYHAGITDFQQLARDFPDQPQFRSLAASFQQDLAGVYVKMKRLEDAEASQLSALAICEDVCASNPDLAQLHENIANAQAVIGRIYRDTSRWEPAEAAFRTAIRINQELHDKHKTPKYKLFKSQLQAEMASGLRANGNLPQALTSLIDAIATLAELRRQFPKDRTVATGLRSAYAQTAEIYGELGQYDKAVQQWNQVLTRSPRDAHDAIVLRRAIPMAQTGSHDTAIQQTEDVLKRAKPSHVLQYLSKTRSYGERLFEAARVYAQAAVGVGQDESLSAGQQQRLAEEYATQAVNHLANARLMGYFDSDEQLEQLRTDDALSPIRERSDFQALLITVTETDSQADSSAEPQQGGEGPPIP